MRVHCEFVQRDWSTIQGAVTGQPGLLGKQVDAIVSSVSITASRAADRDLHQALLPRARPVRRAQGRRSGRPTRRRCAASGSACRHTPPTTLSSPRRFGGIATIVRFDTLPEATAALETGRIDLVMADALALGQSFLKTSAGKGFEFVTPAFTDPAWFGDGVGIVVKPGDSALRAELQPGDRRDPRRWHLSDASRSVTSPSTSAADRPDLRLP